MRRPPQRDHPCCARLMRATQRLSTGEYDTAPWKAPAQQDEIGQLARSFDRMRLDIGAQQKEIMRLALLGTG